MAKTELGGYLSLEYAASLSEFGTPYKLPHCGGWVLTREIPGYPYRDAMGCYPLFSCEDWSKLELDLADLEGQFVSLALVTDPFGDYSPEKLSRVFDTCYLFKHHFVTDLSLPLDTVIRKRTRRYAASALRDLSVEHCDRPEEYLTEWIHLYDYLIERHRISGIRTFSRDSFKDLLKVPGVEMFIARKDNEIVGASIWLVNGDIGYGHLCSVSPLGFELKASYALYSFAIQYFSPSLRWLDYGGVAGTKDTVGGLDMFKSGWASDTRPVYFCGRILDQGKYEELSKIRKVEKTEYFPAYRTGEFL